jgi:predicted nucleic-acid-binding Zn-ribbon protein
MDRKLTCESSEHQYFSDIILLRDRIVLVCQRCGHSEVYSIFTQTKLN